jgi:hypothetical protein
MAQELSFLPDDYLERKAQRRTNAVCGILFLAVMGGIGAAFTLSEKATKQIDAGFAKTEDEYLFEAKRIQQVKDMQEKQKRMAHQAELSASLLEKVPRHHILAEITNLTEPSGVYLFDFNLEARQRVRSAPVDTSKTAYEAKKLAKTGPVAAVAAPAEPRNFDVSMKLTGVADTDVQVATFLNKLGRSKLFRDVNLVISDEFELEEKKLRKFQIELTLDPSADVNSLASAPGKDATTAVEVK